MTKEENKIINTGPDFLSLIARKNLYKRKLILERFTSKNTNHNIKFNPHTGEINLEYNYIPIEQDYYIPVGRG